jgi:hypothetical protein
MPDHHSRIVIHCRVKPRMMLKDGAVAQLSVLQGR